MNQIELIKLSVNVFDVMDKLGIGYPFRGECQIRCPFHDDRSPSARVYSDTNKIHCWVCTSKAWDVLDLVLMSTNMKLPDALKWFEKEFDIKKLAESAKNRKFFALSKKKESLGFLRISVAEDFMRFYWSFFWIGEMIWDRILFCWEVFELVGNTYDELTGWLSNSKFLVGCARKTQFDILIEQKIVSNE